MIRMFSSVISLIYPFSCVYCGKETNNKTPICIFCYNDISLIYSKERTKNLFYGRLNLNFADSLFYFEEKKVSQKIIHALKYESNEKIGAYFGKKIGMMIKENIEKYKIDFLVPIPIHHKRKYKRGYNQSECLSKGISEVCKIRLNTSFLIKVRNNKSQSKKTGINRWKNLSQNFSVNKKITPKHILLVDDVITTGATIEDAAKTILSVFPNIQISIVSLAISKSK
tara:strand:- start:215 stop:892 length:678 start_codon:yes stop_codon:yes gene_type:complete